MMLVCTTSVHNMEDQGGGVPIVVLNQNTKRESGRKVQTGNISAAKTIADVVRTCLGPRAMLKMLMDPMGGICMTNDGNAILREIQVQHPAAKSMIEISRTQDEEVGDGTTSVIVLAGEMLATAEPFLQQKMHPTVIIKAYRQALDDIIDVARSDLARPIDVNDDAAMKEIIKSVLGTKMVSRWMDLAVDLALRAVRHVRIDMDFGRQEIDIKRYCRIEKVPGGTIQDSRIVSGVVLNKDVLHAKMRRRIEKPRIILLDSNLEYKKGESQTNIDISNEDDFTRILELEEESIKKMCDAIIALKPDMIFTEKGISDLAIHFLQKAGITAFRRLKKTDNNRLARASGATIVHDPELLREEDVGTKVELYEVRKIGDEYFCFVECGEQAGACTVLLRGASKDFLNEVERNLNDAMQTVRNILKEPKVVPGGGAVEMELAHIISEKAKSVKGTLQWPYQAVARALEVIPRTLIQNCGASTIRTLTELRAKHAQGKNATWGVDGNSGQLVDMTSYGVWEPLSTKMQVYKTAIETAILLLRIDDIVSGSKKKADEGPGGMPAGAPAPEDAGPPHEE